MHVYRGALAGYAALLWSSVGQAALPGPAPQRRPAEVDVAAAERACQGCHTLIAAEWRASYHHQSATDPAVARALRAERSPFCQGCHIPEALPGERPSDFAVSNGVGCLTCHVPEQVVVSGPDDYRRPAPHPVLRDPAWRPVGACQRCHQFPFPGSGLGNDGASMQRTLAEHAASENHEQPCVTCHMPRTADGHRSHRFPGGHDAAFLRAALLVSADLVSAERVRLQLVPRNVGHAFPTGDLFRSVEVRVSAAQLGGGQVEARRVLTRHQPERGAPWPGDDRLYGPTVVELSLPGAVGAVNWRVTYQRVLMRGRGPRPDLLDGSIVLSQGLLVRNSGAPQAQAGPDQAR